MTDDNGGAAIKARRLALGMSVRTLAALADVDRGQLSRFEAGDTEPQAHWVSRVSAALERAEAEDIPAAEAEPGPAGTPGEPLRFTFHDVFGVGELIVEGPIDRPDELVAAVSKLLAEIRKRGE